MRQERNFAERPKNAAYHAQMVISGALCLCLMAILPVSCRTGPNLRRVALPYIPGVYEGLGQGFRGPILVAVTVDSGGITGIEILEHGEDETPGAAAMEELLELVLDWGGTDIDAVSGATESSTGFLTALEDALVKGSANQSGNR